MAPPIQRHKVRDIETRMMRAGSGAPLLFLESNSKLHPAIRLYESSGFTHVARPAGDAHYQRADVYMEWQGR